MKVNRKYLCRKDFQDNYTYQARSVLSPWPSTFLKHSTPWRRHRRAAEWLESLSRTGAPLGMLPRSRNVAPLRARAHLKPCGFCSTRPLLRWQMTHFPSYIDRFVGSPSSPQRFGDPLTLVIVWEAFELTFISPMPQGWDHLENAI